MNRLFSMVRRVPNLVDLVIPRTSAAVDGFRIQTSPNFDGAWTTRFTATNVGFVDANVKPAVLTAHSLGYGAGYGPPVRCVFDPATYGITDTSSFWMRYVPVTGGVAGTPGAATLCLPASAHHGTGIVTIRGTAPSGANSAAAQQIDLPSLVQDLRIQNEETATALFISTEQDGPETRFAGSTVGNTVSLLGTQGSLWVRGGGATAVFSATFTLAFPR